MPIGALSRAFFLSCAAQGNGLVDAVKSGRGKAWIIIVKTCLFEVCWVSARNRGCGAC